jgi:hypothetical protein
MKKILAFSTIAVAILAGSAFLGTAEQAAAKDYEFCRQDSSGTLSCGFDTMEQCVAMMSGRGGTCSRNPFLPDANAAYAQAPKRHGQTHRQRAE